MTDDSSTQSVVSIATTNGIELTNDTSKTIEIPTDSEELATFTAKATSSLGNSDITIKSVIGKEQRSATSTLSVRPATTYITDIRSGIIDSSDTKISNFKIDLYPEYATRRLYISQGASAMIVPLFKYLENYDYPCTEQLISRAIPYAIMPDNKILGTNFDESAKIINKTISTLKNRQNDDGSFALWSGGATSYNNENNTNTAYLTAYVAQFLKTAKDAGFTVPNDMLSRALDYLRTFAGGTITDEDYAAATAYAIYVISDNGFVATSYIDAFTEYANANIKDWESKLMGAYIGTAYKILKQEDLAQELISKYEPSSKKSFEYNGLFSNSVANDAMYYYLTNKYFTPQNPMNSVQINSYLDSGNYSAYTSAIVILGLSGSSNTAANKLFDNFSVSSDSDIATIITKTDAGIFADIPADASKISITCPKCGSDNQMFYTLLQQGFPLQSQKESNGIEIIREYYDINGNKITSANIGDTITVKIFARTRGDVDFADNVVITDLLPGGFIPNTESATGDAEFIEMREDRVLIYADLNRAESQFTYTAQLGTSGTFTVPAIRAESMYNPRINAVGASGTIQVLNEASK